MGLGIISQYHKIDKYFLFQVFFICQFKRVIDQLKILQIIKYIIKVYQCLNGIHMINKNNAVKYCSKQ